MIIWIGKYFEECLDVPQLQFWTCPYYEGQPRPKKLLILLTRWLPALQFKMATFSYSLSPTVFKESYTEHFMQEVPY